MKRSLMAVATTMLVAGTGWAAGNDPTAAAMERIQKIMSKQSLSAKVVMTVTGAKRGGKMPPMEFQMYLSKGKSRMEMDYAKMAAAGGAGAGEMPPGMDKMVSITRPDKKVVYMVIPGLKAYCEMPIPDAAAEKGETPKVERKVLGPETIEKYACEKVLNTVTAADGTRTEVTTWEAKELGGLPVKMETETPDGKMTMVFKDISKAAPADSLFEPPAGATKYASMQEMMMSGMMKMMPQGN